MSVSFKEVVESFAIQHDLPFYPRPPKSGHYQQHAEDKQLYLLGTCVCYIEQNVLFVQASALSKQSHPSAAVGSSGPSRWVPVDLEEILPIARRK